MKRIASLLGAAGVILLAATATPAAVIFDSLGATNYAYGTVDANNRFGQSFVTDGNSYMLSSVVLRMLGGNGLGGFTVSLYDTTGPGNTPGAWLETLVGSANPHVPGDYTFTGAAVLSPNTSYYVVPGIGNGVGSYVWQAHNPPLAPTTGSTIGYTASLDGGATWLGIYNIASFDMQVNAVPEPRAWTAAGLVLAGLGIFVIRRRQVTASQSI